MIPRELLQDAEILLKRGFDFEFVENGPHIYMQFSEFPLPSEIYNMETTDLLIFTTPDYPCAGFDMFWTNQKLSLKGDTLPKQADVIESYLGRDWRRGFSYHPNQNIPWNPAEDNVDRYIGYVQQRLQNGD